MFHSFLCRFTLNVISNVNFCPTLCFERKYVVLETKCFAAIFDIGSELFFICNHTNGRLPFALKMMIMSLEGMIGLKDLC